MKICKGDWVANVEEARVHVVYGLDYWQRYDLGPPMRTKKYSEKELVDMGLVGVYSKPRKEK